MPIEKADFRRVLGSFAAGVTVVTTVGSDQARYGLTATAFTSVSLDPPLVLVCVDKRSESLPHIQSSKVFAVNFLSRANEATSQRFASSGGDKFSGLVSSLASTGAPILPDVVGFVDCRVVNTIEAGDHFVFIGLVEAASCSDDAQPLLYFRGAYRSVS